MIVAPASTGRKVKERIAMADRKTLDTISPRLTRRKSNANRKAKPTPPAPIAPMVLVTALPSCASVTPADLTAHPPNAVAKALSRL
jgi:hypothetical protein